MVLLSLVENFSLLMTMMKTKTMVLEVDETTDKVAYSYPTVNQMETGEAVVKERYRSDFQVKVTVEEEEEVVLVLIEVYYSNEIFHVDFVQVD